MALPDIAIKQSSPLLPDPQLTRRVPSYLVVLEDGKKDILFLATKFEEQTAQAPKFTGFQCNQSQEEIVAEYEQILKTTDKNNFVEMHFPWSRIKSVRSLMFRQK